MEIVTSVATVFIAIFTGYSCYIMYLQSNPIIELHILEKNEYNFLCEIYIYNKNNKTFYIKNISSSYPKGSVLFNVRENIGTTCPFKAKATGLSFPDFEYIPDKTYSEKLFDSYVPCEKGRKIRLLFFFKPSTMDLKYISIKLESTHSLFPIKKKAYITQ